VAPRRGIVVVFSLVGLAVLVGIAGIAILLFAAGRGPSIRDSSTLVLRPGGELQEMVPDDVVGQLLGGEAATVRSFVQALQMAKQDARITNVLLMPASLELPYWAKLQELRDAVLDFRESGKTVVAFLEYGSDREYYLASAADRVYLLPTSPLDLTGVASYEIFLRGTLDKLGIYPDFVHIGDYKTAPNQLTETQMTPAHREMSEALNRDMYDQLVRGIAEGRDKDEAEVRAILDQGPFTPEDALRLGLVDDLAYEDQLDDRMPELQADEERRVEGTAYQRIRPQSIGLRPRSRIAVIYAVGTIVSGKSGFDPINGGTVGSDTMVEQIRRVRDDDSIKAVVLRVDSPGGSAVASDVIWRELMITRDEQPSRPLITSMSDLAASGGYYIAMPGQVIVAQPATLTGSIGIYSGKMALGGAAGKLGVTTEAIVSGANADIYSPFAPFTPAQREKVQDFMQSFYDTFVEKAAASRGTTPERIDAVAQGRVWTGAQALRHGLVDELGGLDRAVEIAKERAGIPEDEEVQLVAYPPRRTWYEALSQQFGGGGAGIRGLLSSPWHPDRLASLGLSREALIIGRTAAETSPLRLFRRGEPLALMPFAFVR
jgi:protease-4